MIKRQPPISIHALREEGDLISLSIVMAAEIFLSTPSARRATGGVAAVFRSFAYFYPRPPRGGRRHRRRKQHRRQFISIHALREEGDSGVLPVSAGLRYFYPRPPRGGRRAKQGRAAGAPRFLSTPSARRATRDYQADFVLPDISIHALREEGDKMSGG